MKTTYYLSRRSAMLALLSLPALPSLGQPPSVPAQEVPILLFIATGSTTEADIAQLRDALSKVVGVEHVETTVRTGGVILRIKGSPVTRLLAVQAKTVGYNLRPMPLATYAVSGSSATADLMRLRQTLSTVEGVERVDITGIASNAKVRVLGDVRVAPLAAAAKSVGFDLLRSSYFIVGGSTEAADVERLDGKLKEVDGVTKFERHSVAGGAMLGIQGVMEDDALVAAAKSAGYDLKILVDPANGPFIVTGVANAGDEEKLRKAIEKVPGIGHFLIEQTPEGTLLTLPISIAKPEVVAAAAKAGGFNMRPLYPFFDASGSVNVERDTPPASNDRILEDLTKVGDLAPDFTLITKDGKSKVTLSDYRAKKPVVLIFGSYT